MAVMDGDT